MEDARGPENKQKLPPSIVAAAHELKAPLALIRQLGFSLESGQMTAENQAKLASRIVLSSERALRLTSDLTRGARLSDGLFELEPINPVELCEDVASELEPLFRAHDSRILVKRGRSSYLAIANRDLLRRILANFSDNALRYLGENKTVELTVSLKRGKVRIGVRDHGPAMPAKLKTKLQNSLGSARQPLQARPSSSGLGLYLSSQFAEQMNGRIGAINHRGGTTFYVELLPSTQLSLL